MLRQGIALPLRNIKLLIQLHLFLFQLFDTGAELVVYVLGHSSPSTLCSKQRSLAIRSCSSATLARASSITRSASSSSASMACAVTSTSGMGTSTSWVPITTSFPWLCAYTETSLGQISISSSQSDGSRRLWMYSVVLIVVMSL